MAGKCVWVGAPGLASEVICDSMTETHWSRYIVSRAAPRKKNGNNFLPFIFFVLLSSSRVFRTLLYIHVTTPGFF